MAVLFCKSLGKLQGKTSGDEEAFTHAFDHAQHVLTVRGRLGDLWWLVTGRKFRKSCRTVHKFVDEMVSATLKESEDSPNRYIFIRALAAQNNDARVLCDQSINVILAGRDTTACLLSWTLKFLAKHQNVQNQLREEAISLASFFLGHLPTPSEIKAMTFLNHVLLEVLRLYPSIPVNMRSALKTTTLPVGGGPDGKSSILVKKGEAVGYCVYTMHRRTDVWGEDALHFRPSRWGEQKAKDAGYWAYLPFNGGQRICLGQEFALLEAGYTVVRLLQTFNGIGGHEMDPLESPHNLTLVVAPADGCNVTLS